MLSISSTPPDPQTDWIAQPAQATNPPNFPGLYRDNRHVLVAESALIRLQMESATTLPHNRLAQLIADISQNLSLNQVEVWQTPTTDLLLRLNPGPVQHTPRSYIYDALATYTTLLGERLYIGEKVAFIQYRDEHAPHGYDMFLPNAINTDNFYLVDTDGHHIISRQELKPYPLQELCLGMPLLKIPAPQPVTTLFLLTQSRLYRLLARYLKKYQLNYRLGHIQSAETAQQLVIFEINSEQEAPISPFILTYLTTLPHTVLLTEAVSTLNQRMLIQWGYTPSCRPDHLIDIFPPDSLLFFVNHLDYTSFWVMPAPLFVNDTEIISLKFSGLKQDFQAGDFTPASSPPPTLALPLRLINTNGPTSPIAALYLDEKEIGWVRELLYRLPAPVFDTYQIWLGDREAILLSTNHPLTHIPFGSPFRQVQGGNLFIPWQSNLAPSLPLSQLAETLNLQAGVYTFLSNANRYNIPQTAFRPLSKQLIQPDSHQHLTIDLQIPTEIPVIQINPEATMTLNAPSTEQLQTSKETILNQDRRSLEADNQSEKERGTPPPDANTLLTGEHNSLEKIDALRPLLLKHGETYHQTGDYLAAAICFALAGDHKRAGDCYEHAAQDLSSHP